MYIANINDSNRFMLYLNPKLSSDLIIKVLITIICILFIPVFVFANGFIEPSSIENFSNTVYGYLGLIFFIVAYGFVLFEEKLHMRKSKPVMIAAGIIWILVALAYLKIGDTHTPHEAIKKCLLEYAELFLFLLAAMTYINAIEERNVFQFLRVFLVSRGYSLRNIFWITGMLAFTISPVADNLTTALIMGAVVMAVGGNNKKFVAIACVNIVVAANAGGAFSPFGDITTLMVWQKGKVEFSGFFAILIPSLVNWLIPAIVMSFSINKDVPQKIDETVSIKYGALFMVSLFLLTIITAVFFHSFLHLPSAAGMMFGLGYLGIFSYHVKRHESLTDSFDNILGLQEGKSPHPMDLLREKTGNFSEIINNFEIPAFIVNNDHIVTHWNKACEKLTGVSADSIVGTNRQWCAFYPEKRPVMADLIVENASEKNMARYYKDKYRESVKIESAFEVKDFFPDLGEKGKWLFITAAPVKDKQNKIIGAVTTLKDYTTHKKDIKHFDVMKSIARSEWDTLLFFYGITLCVGGLAQFGYLELLSNHMYHGLGTTIANSLVGVLSAIFDNIPVMFAVLSMDPSMPVGQWLLVTLTAGTGGSILAIGSAAGVALLGTAKGAYTFGRHLKWAPIIFCGYVAGIICHIIINSNITFC